MAYISWPNFRDQMWQIVLFYNNNNNLFVKQYNTCTYIIADSNSYNSANHQVNTEHICIHID